MQIKNREKSGSWTFFSPLQVFFSLLIVVVSLPVFELGAF